MSIGKKEISARLGAGLEPVCSEPGIRIVNISGLNGNFRSIACLEFSAKYFGKARLKAGDRIEFASTFFTHCRAYKMDWKGEFTLRR